MSLLKVNEIENLAGGDPGIQGAAKAFVNFDGEATPPTIRYGFNVSSVVRNATGEFTVNFTEPMVDAAYSVSATGLHKGIDTFGSLVHGSESGAPTESSVRLTAWVIAAAGGGSNVRSNLVDVCVTIHR